MTPKQKAAHAKRLKDLDNVTSIAASPGNAHANQYMLGMANGLILAQSIFTDKEPAYLTAPETFLSERLTLGGDTKATDPVTDAAVADTNGFDEEFLIGLWLADQRRSGATTVDLEKVEHIREGMRYALELRSPA